MTDRTKTKSKTMRRASETLAELIHADSVAEVSRDEAARMGAFDETAIDLTGALAATADEAQEVRHD